MKTGLGYYCTCRMASAPESLCRGQIMSLTLILTLDQIK